MCPTYEFMKGTMIFNETRGGGHEQMITCKGTYKMLNNNYLFHITVGGIKLFRRK
jgi:hypothetical protein